MSTHVESDEEEMKLTLKRSTGNDVCTLGELLVDGEHECFTCEDPVRETEAPVKEWKIAGETAIPRGTYEVIITHSVRFKRELPLLLNVPGFSGVRIHPGNTAEQTEGCVLVGNLLGANAVLESRNAFNALFEQMQDALAGGEKIHIEVS